VRALDVFPFGHPDAARERRRQLRSDTVKNETVSSSLTVINLWSGKRAFRTNRVLITTKEQ
jgi:hypothetical protein